jgi:hypothetical protein
MALAVNAIRRFELVLRLEPRKMRNVHSMPALLAPYPRDNFQDLGYMYLNQAIKPPCHDPTCSGKMSNGNGMDR